MRGSVPGLADAGPRVAAAARGAAGRPFPAAFRRRLRRRLGADHRHARRPRRIRGSVAGAARLPRAGSQAGSAWTSWTMYGRSSSDARSLPALRSCTGNEARCAAWRRRSGSCSTLGWRSPRAGAVRGRSARARTPRARNGLRCTFGSSSVIPQRSTRGGSTLRSKPSSLLTSSIPSSCSRPGKLATRRGTEPWTRYVPGAEPLPTRRRTSAATAGCTSSGRSALPHRLRRKSRRRPWTNQHPVEGWRRRSKRPWGSATPHRRRRRRRRARLPPMPPTRLRARRLRCHPKAPCQRWWSRYRLRPPANPSLSDRPPRRLGRGHSGHGPAIVNLFVRATSSAATAGPATRRPGSSAGAAAMTSSRPSSSPCPGGGESLPAEPGQLRSPALVRPSGMGPSRGHDDVGSWRSLSWSLSSGVRHCSDATTCEGLTTQSSTACREQLA